MADNEKLRRAREAMSELLPLTPSMWQDWAKDEAAMGSGYACCSISLSLVLLGFYTQDVYWWFFLIFSNVQTWDSFNSWKALWARSLWLSGWFCFLIPENMQFRFVLFLICRSIFMSFNGVFDDQHSWFSDFEEIPKHSTFTHSSIKWLLNQIIE